MILLLSLGMAAPQDDFRRVLEQRSDCEQAQARLRSSPSYLKSQLRNSNPERLLLASYLLLFQEEKKEEFFLPLAQRFTQAWEGRTQESPSLWAKKACMVLAASQSGVAAREVALSGATGLWMHDCIPLLGRADLSDQSIWNVLVRESQVVFNRNEVRTYLKRRGSDSFLFYVEKFGHVLPAESYTLLADVILGLTPKNVPSKALDYIQFYQKRGAPMLLDYGSQERKEFISLYDQTLDRLGDHFSLSPDHRVDTPTSLWTYGIPKYLFCAPKPQ
ncbi:MAG: hypothetical protein VX278_08765 [Myxococcota bacterium]|nr:hypothetical protein [Myxococcota bacterium]